MTIDEETIAQSAIPEHHHEMPEMTLGIAIGIDGHLDEDQERLNRSALRGMLESDRLIPGILGLFELPSGHRSDLLGIKVR